MWQPHISTRPQHNIGTNASMALGRDLHKAGGTEITGINSTSMEESKVTLVFCLREECPSGYFGISPNGITVPACYCCQKPPRPVCYKSEAECRAHCYVCNPTCH
jgi:hypothetical protein